jgi:hypothetical protein
MPRQKLKVVYLDGKEIEAKITPRAEVATERFFERGMAKLQDDAHAEHLYYLAWAALHYADKEPRAFEHFLSDIEDIEMVSNPKDTISGDDVDPTQPAQPLDS